MLLSYYLKEMMVVESKARKLRSEKKLLDPHPSSRWAEVTPVLDQGMLCLDGKF
jgi:hypothetical protein